MNITFRPTNYQTLADCKLLAKWEGDFEIRHLLLPFRDEESYRKLITAEEIQANRRKANHYQHYSVDLMILEDGKPVGHGTIVYDIPHRLTREGKVAWFGLVIGEPSARGKGIGRIARQHLEKMAVADGATHIEASAFEFNETSLHLIRSMGYEEIGRVEKITFWQGRLWADIRFLKKLGAP